MSSSLEAFPFSDAELERAGLLGDGESFVCHPASQVGSPVESGNSFVFVFFVEDALGLLARPSPPSRFHAYLHSTGVSERTNQVLETMRLHPDSISESLIFISRLYHTYHLPSRALHPYPRLYRSLNRKPWLASLQDHCFRYLRPHHLYRSTASSEFSPSAFERASYYNGITGDDDHPILVYRSDFSTTLFTRPIGSSPLSLSNLSAIPHKYRTKRKELDTQEAVDAWTQRLEHDLAELHDLDPEENVQKVVDIADELMNIVCPPCYTMLSRCSRSSLA